MGALVVAAVAGAVSSTAFLRSEARDCRLHLPSSWEAEVEGRFLGRPSPGSTAPFRLEAGAPGGCRGVVRATVTGPGPAPPAGERIRVPASWEGRSFAGPGRAEWAGRLRTGGGWEPVRGGGLPGGVLRLRGRVQGRMLDLWGPEVAPVVEALVLARREHLDPELRDAFALSGTAHLLAISGFHVGVIAALLLGALRLSGLRPRPAATGAACGCWAYVMAIGAPHAAVRAALLLTLLVAARVRGRPVVPAGAFGSALLILLAVNPGWLASVGFQLSFAGTGGLVFLRGVVGRGIDQLWGAVSGRPLPRGRAPGLGAGLLRGGAAGVTAGIAATLPTLPFLAWHFDRVSVLGIPATLLVAPVVTIAIPGIGIALLASWVPGVPAEFLAGGTALLLELVGRAVIATSRLPGASIWVSRPSLVSAVGGGSCVYLLLRHFRAGRVRAPARRVAATGAGAVLVVLLPLLPVGRSLELHLIDVGQGDAIAVRSPAGRWVLVDAGPRGPGFDAGMRRVVPYLKRQGVRRIEAVVLTHPHLDHIGGAPAVLREFRVRGAMDPFRPHGSRPYLDLLSLAREREVSWWAARAGLGFELDQLRVRVLHPDEATATDPHLDDPNDLSVVLLLEWRETAILLTGDAPAMVERQVLEALPLLTVLKVGHHGSRTSTSLELLAHTSPRYALIGVGEGNGFGHPHDLVMDRLLASGVEVLRTDRDGDVRIRVGRDGSIQVRTSR